MDVNQASRTAKTHTQLNAQKSARHPDPRFKQLLHKARDGDETAVHELWTGFDFDYEREGGRDDLD